MLQLLSSWHTNKQKSEQSEAANAATSLMQAIEGAKTTGDWTPVHVIMHNNEKLFNKVYKGWLQKSEMQEKQKQSKQKPPDPDVQGFEQGVQQYLSKKQGGQPPPGGQQGPPQAPRAVGGYQLPAASPPQQLQQQAVSAERQAQRQDPGRSLQGQLSSGEQRTAELAKTGQIVTPEQQLKYDTEMAKSKAEITKTYSEVQIAQQNAQRAQSEYQRATTLAQTETEKGGIELKKADSALQKAVVDLDISKSKLQLQMMKTKMGPNAKTPPAGLRQRYVAATQAEAAVQDILDSPRAAHGFTKQDVQDLQGLLRSAGSTALAGSLPGWYGAHLPNWLGGSGKADVQSMLDSIKSYKTGLKDTLDGGFPGWDGKKKEATGDEVDGPAEGETDEDALPEEGDEVNFSGFVYRFDGKQYVKTTKKAPN